MAENHKPLSEFTDKELADMVRNGAYAKGTCFDENNRFLLVLAVPYGKVDTVETLQEAVEAFFQLVQDDDYRERNIQVYDHEAPEGEEYSEVTLEEIEAEEEEDDEPGECDCDDRSWYGEKHDTACPLAGRPRE